MYTYIGGFGIRRVKKKKNNKIVGTYNFGQFRDARVWNVAVTSGIIIVVNGAFVRLVAFFFAKGERVCEVGSRFTSPN